MIPKINDIRLGTETLVEKGFGWLEIYEDAFKNGRLIEAQKAIKEVELARQNWESEGSA